MAVPKKRAGKCAQGHRRAHWKATLSETVKCTNCGFYGGKLVSEKLAEK